MILLVIIALYLTVIWLGYRDVSSWYPLLLAVPLTLIRFYVVFVDPYYAQQPLSGGGIVKFVAANFGEIFIAYILGKAIFRLKSELLGR